MTDILYSPLFEQIRKYLEDYDSASRTIFLFVPYIKTDILKKLIDGVNSRIVIVTSWKPRDIRSGSSDLDLYPYCKEQNITLYVNNKLHAKVYSIDMTSMILGTGNISKGGLQPNGNYEAGVFVPDLTSMDRLYFEKIRSESRLVDDSMYERLKKWLDDNVIEEQKDTVLEEIVPEPRENDFLISALPMTRSVDELVEGYARIAKGSSPSDDQETAACIFHDIANYDIRDGLSEQEFVKALQVAFFAHPFIQKIDEFIDHEAYFGRIKEWIQGNCTDVPVPSRRDLTGNVQVLLEWFVVLGEGRYEVDVPSYSQRIKKNF